MSRRDGLTIGRLAAGSGVNLETIRYYERIGLMPEPDRTPGGHRSYANEHRRRLTFIRRARELGFGLDDIRTLIVLSEPGRQSCAEVKKIAEGHLDIVRSKIADLVKLEAALQDASQRCGDGAVPDCPVIQVLGGA
ncbi:helix-turn-helix domain-containing protein [Caulobacter sp. 17J65-9]|uniref:MerR family transcriptional regulator n=1 Tax=Caulobacter sp. 17J65-9 TaxID=2709382 RepID=UPI0013CBA0AB|nr:helix-turn-helix domain-containing protein [Caulobacter sp. 17J65-9]NEX91251.1 helix-turn-helix domain-containing protein [Caulobacter sp. 17J65-9]